MLVRLYRGHALLRVAHQAAPHKVLPFLADPLPDSGVHRIFACVWVVAVDERGARAKARLCYLELAHQGALHDLVLVIPGEGWRACGRRRLNSGRWGEWPLVACLFVRWLLGHGRVVETGGEPESSMNTMTPSDHMSHASS